MNFSLKPGIKLRGHHLICLHFFRGEGYDSHFIENLRNVLEKAEAGEDIEVCSGADDICRKCPYLKKGECLYDENAEHETKEMDSNALRLMGLENHINVKWEDIKRKIPGILPEWSRRYCKDCDWQKVCGLI